MYSLLLEQNVAQWVRAFLMVHSYGFSKWILRNAHRKSCTSNPICNSPASIFLGHYGSAYDSTQLLLVACYTACLLGWYLTIH